MERRLDEDVEYQLILYAIEVVNHEAAAYQNMPRYWASEMLQLIRCKATASQPQIQRLFVQGTQLDPRSYVTFP